MTGSHCGWLRNSFKSHS
uniref:Uncharacterized protein n=1 Tax=Anguilla anguilla TaxID=7936 RepID=A0A0E9VI82_ANGAN